MNNRHILSISLAVVLVLLTTPLYLTIAGLSVMALDDPSGGWQPWAFIGVVGVLCVLIPLLSLIFCVRFLRKDRIPAGLMISLIPAIILAVFWAWLSQQSFT